MNEQEQLMQIISAISEKTGEAPEKVVAMLQEIMQTEGQEGVKAFINKMLNSDAEMFRKGGKMEAAVNKFQRGGVYNRAQGRQNKRDAGIYYDTKMADYTARGAQNQGAKIAKAKAVQGFENANFIDPEDFDRSIYRQRKREARDMDFTRRQRKAYALTEQPDVEIRELPAGLISPIRQRLDIPKRTPGKAVIEVGDITAEVLSDPIPPKQTPVKTVNVGPKNPIRKAGWDQFFYENYYRDKNNGGDIRPDQSMMGYQRAMEDEYRKYFADPENYVRGSIDPETINKYDRLVRRGVERLKYSSPSKNAGYYDPETSYVTFGDTQAPLLTTDTGKAMNKVAHGITGTILATAAAPKVAEGVVDAGKAVYNGGKRLWETYRDAYKAQQQYLNQGGARGSEVRQMSYHRPTLNNHTMPEGYVVPQQGVGVESMYVPAERLMGFLGLKKGGKINKCQEGEKFGNDGIKRIGVYFDDKTGNREVEDASGRYIRTTFPQDTIWTFNDYGTNRSVYTTPKGRVGYIDDIYGRFDTLSLADIKKVVDAVEARMKNFTKDERRNYAINRYGDEMLMPENKSSKDKKKK